MNQDYTHNFLTSNVSALTGVGAKTKKLLKKKKIKKLSPTRYGDWEIKGRSIDF